jgi:hypothetical protein
MTMRVTQNRKRGRARVLITDVAAGVTTITPSTDLVSSSVDAAGVETVTGAYITRVYFGNGGSATGYWEIKRNSIVLLTLSGTGELDFDQEGADLSNDSTFPVVCTLVGSTQGSLVIDFAKQSTTVNTTLGG